MLALATDFARRCASTLERWLAAKETSEEHLFASMYYPVPNTDPPKFTTDWDRLSDRDVLAIEEAVLARSPVIVYAVLVDRFGYLPTHNARYSQPLTGNLANDLVNNRTKRIFNDRAEEWNNAYSLWLARDAFRDGALLVNGDTVHPAVVEENLLAARGAGVLLAVDQEKPLGDEEMKILVSEDGRLRRISKSVDPRTAAGITKGCADLDPVTSCRLFLLTVDGRQASTDWSTGVRLPVLARLMLDAGAWTAVNLDGGGSTTMWTQATDPAYCQSYPSAGGCLVMRPSQSSGERATRSAIDVLGAPDTGAPDTLR